MSSEIGQSDVRYLAEKFAATPGVASLQGKAEEVEVLFAALGHLIETMEAEPTFSEMVELQRLYRSAISKSIAWLRRGNTHRGVAKVCKRVLKIGGIAGTVLVAQPSLPSSITVWAYWSALQEFVRGLEVRTNVFRAIGTGVPEIPSFVGLSETPLANLPSEFSTVLNGAAELAMEGTSEMLRTFLDGYEDRIEEYRASVRKDSRLEGAGRNENTLAILALTEATRLVIEAAMIGAAVGAEEKTLIRQDVARASANLAKVCSQQVEKVTEVYGRCHPALTTLLQEWGTMSIMTLQLSSASARPASLRPIRRELIAEMSALGGHKMAFRNRHAMFAFKALGEEETHRHEEIIRTVLHKEIPGADATLNFSVIAAAPDDEDSVLRGIYVAYFPISMGTTGVQARVRDSEPSGI